MVWETVSRELYQGSDPYVVKGYIAGTTIPASITITPADPLEYMDGVIDTNGDTYIQVSPSDSKFGDNEVIRIKNYTGSFKRIGVVQFDFESMDTSNLTEMTLKLYFNKMDDKAEVTETYLNIYTNTPGWVENTATYDSITQASGYKAELVKEHVVIKRDQVGSYITIDVSDAIDFMEGGKISFILDIEENPEADANGSNSGLEFASKEAGKEKAPKLYVSNQYVLSLIHI